MQGKSPLVRVKEPYGKLDMVLQPGVYKVRLPLMLMMASGSNIEKKYFLLYSCSGVVVFNPHTCGKWEWKSNSNVPFNFGRGCLFIQVIIKLIYRVPKLT